MNNLESTSNQNLPNSSGIRGRHIKKGNKFQIWQQNFESRREDLVDMSLHHEDRVKKINSVLNDEERINGANKNYKEGLKGVGMEKKNGLASILPEKVQNNINETRRINDDLKKRVDEISKMNALYVIKHGSKYLNMANQTNTSNLSAKLPKINEVKKYVENVESSTKGPGNFRYINENYRAQLMRAFLNFNPLIHLNNLRNLLEKADPAIQKDINHLWQTIERDLKEVLDPNYYRKKYDKIVNENKFRKVGLKELSPEKTSPSSSTISDQITKEKIISSSNKLSTKNANIMKNINDKKKTVRKQNKDKYEVESIKEFISLINRMTNEKRLESYIDTAKNENEEIQLDKHMGLYFKEMKGVEEVLKNIQSIKLKSTEQELREAKSLALIQNEDIVKTIQIIRNNLLKDMNTDSGKKI